MGETVQSPDETEPNPYQVMPEMDDDAREALKEDIRRNGVEDPVHIDENGNIIDGHHRVEICNELGIEDYPTKIHVGLSDQEKRDLAYRLNLQQRHLEHGQKQEIVEQYLVEDWDGIETQSAIAEKLGVSRQTVSKSKQNVISKLDVVKTTANDSSGNESDSDETKSDDEQDDDEQDDDEQNVSFSTFSPTGDDEVREKSKEIGDAANEGDEAATEKAEEVDGRGETAVDNAHKDVERHQEREEKREQIDETPEVPDGEYEVLLADPPWQYDHQQSPNRDVENHYLTMSLSEIKDMDVPAADNAVLYLWTTAPKLEEAFGVLDAWGFEYTTCAVWDKQKIGMGYWFRGQHELILVAKRGSFSPPEPEDRVSSVISEPRGEHSEKPDALHELIESAFPNRSKIELFARDARDGWDSWGDEV